MAQKVPIHTAYIRLDAFLKLSGAAATGGEAKVKIQAGEVSVNGEVCLMRGKKLRAGDVVSLAGRALEVAGG